MNASHKEARPDDERRHDVGMGGAKPEPLKAERQENTERGDAEAVEIQSAGVEQGDDEDRDDVVDDGERQQKDADVARNGFSEQRQHADGERDVGCRRYRPALVVPRSGSEGQIDQRGNGDTAESRQHRQNGLIEPAERALMDLTADFHADDEEEHRHQRVVDPEMQRPHEGKLADAKWNRQVPEVMIGMGKG